MKKEREGVGMDELLKIGFATSDETRLRILAFLAREGECCVCELEASLGIFQSRISRHLKILKEAGFLEVKRKGKWAYYALTSQAPLQALFIEQISKLSLPLPPKISACEIKGEES